MIEDRVVAIALNTISYMTPVIFRKIKENFSPISDIFRSSSDDIARITGSGPLMANRIKALDFEKQASQELLKADKIGASIVTIYDQEYPASVNHPEFSPPAVLSFIGDLPADSDFLISIVGSRIPTNYGKFITEKFTEALVRSGACIVSGLARGVDKISHIAALEAKGRTIAILGNGLNIYYPPENRSLQDKIAKEGGCIVSQFPVDAVPDKVNFPIRNYLIASFSAGTLVTEAAARSGSLITARLALELGKEVFAVPGPVNSKKSEGTNSMIQSGYAKLVSDVKDILDELPEYLINKNEKIFSEPLDLKLTDREAILIKYIDTAPVHIDKISENSGFPIKELSVLLMELELKGIVKQTDNRSFYKI